MLVGELQGRLDAIRESVKALLKDTGFLNGILLWAQSNNDIDISVSGEEESLASRFVETHFHLMDADLSAITSILVSLSSLSDRVSSTKARFFRFVVYFFFFQFFNFFLFF